MNRNPNTFGASQRTPGGTAPQRRSDAPIPAPALEIVELTPSRKPGNLRAFAAVRFGKYLTIRGWRVVQQGNQAPWASVPMQERSRPDGSARFFPVIDLPESWKKAACNAVIEAWETYQRDGSLPGVHVIGGGRAA